MVESYFSHEQFDAKLVKKSYESSENKMALDILKEIMRRVKNGYETGLLWGTKNIVMPNNFSMTVFSSFSKWFRISRQRLCQKSLKN